MASPREHYRVMRLINKKQDPAKAVFRAQTRRKQHNKLDAVFTFKVRQLYIHTVPKIIFAFIISQFVDVGGMTALNVHPKMNK